MTRAHQYEILDKSENKRMARKGRPHPIHNAPKRRKEADDTDTDSDHRISHFHDLGEEDHFKVQIIIEKRNAV